MFFNLDGIFDFSGLTDVLPKCYHLDLVSTLAAPNGTAFQSQRSRRKIPNSAMISPHDLDEASLFYRRVWMFLTAGQIETLKAYLDRVGEPWLGSLVDGKKLRIVFFLEAKFFQRSEFSEMHYIS